MLPTLSLLIAVIKICSGQCPCDYYPDSCDKLCCCDSLCSEEDKIAFNNGCFSNDTLYYEHFCYNSSLLTNPLNSGLLFKYTDDHTICFLKPAYYENNFYISPKLLASVEDVDLVQSKYKPTGVFSSKSIQNATIYSFKEKVMYLTKDLSIGYASLSDLLDVEYLTNATITKDVSSVQDCSLLNSYTSYQDQIIIGDPSLLTLRLTPEQLLDIKNNQPAYYSLIRPKEFCIDSNGATVACALNKADCSTVLKGYFYRFLTTQGRISNVELYFVIGSFGNVRVQSFGAYFFSNSLPKSLSPPNEPVKRLRTQGYTPGCPVIIGTLIASKYSVSRFPLASSIYKGKLDGFPYAFSYIPGPGPCNSVDFGYPLLLENFSSKCYIEITQATGTCANLQARILSFLSGGFGGSFTNTHVSIFANNTDSVSDQPAQWIKVNVIDTGPNTVIQTKDNLCLDIVTGLRVKFSTQIVGNKLNPSLAINGMNIELIRGSIKFKCFGSLCNDAQRLVPQRVSLSLFVEYSLNAEVTPTNSFNDVNYRFPFIGNQYNYKIKAKSFV